MIILEVIDHLGRIKEQHKVAGDCIRVGRAYDNDLILSDPFICANHIEIETQDDGTVAVRDLDSLNGLYQYSKKSRVESLQLANNEKMRIGHTILRYRSSQYQVAPTREDRLATDLVNNLLNSTVIFWLSYLVLALFVALVSHLTSYSEFKALDLFRSELLPYLMVLLIWAGFWALLSRITTHNFYFKAHSIIASATLFFSLMFDEFIDPLLRFSFHLGIGVDRLALFFSLALIAVAFYAHLRFCSGQSARRLASYSIIISASIMGIAYMQGYEDEDYFSGYPAYHDVIMPPGYQMVSDSSFDEFFAEVDKLDERLSEQMAMREDEEDEPLVSRVGEALKE